MATLIGINGKPFDMGRINIETKLGTAEVWEVVSVGMAHPFHVHGALFRILYQGGRASSASHGLEGHSVSRGQSRASGRLQPARQRASIRLCIIVTFLSTRMLD
jgi:FtsP/CotA-like multicopper oxidase with cupredoxin domain